MVFFQYGRQTFRKMNVIALEWTWSSQKDKSTPSGCDGTVVDRTLCTTFRHVVLSRDASNWHFLFHTWYRNLKNLMSKAMKSTRDVVELEVGSATDWINVTDSGNVDFMTLTENVNLMWMGLIWLVADSLNQVSIFIGSAVTQSMGTWHGN